MQLTCAQARRKRVLRRRVGQRCVSPPPQPHPPPRRLNVMTDGAQVFATGTVKPPAALPPFITRDAMHSRAVQGVLTIAQNYTYDGEWKEQVEVHLSVPDTFTAAPSPAATPMSVKPPAAIEKMSGGAS